MKSPLPFQIAASPNAPVKGIRLVTPSQLANASRCESYIHIGLFFDGTQNNVEKDKAKSAHSNIARLSFAYRDEKAAGFYNIYIPGVGTPFPDIGDDGEGALSSAFGTRCEERVLFGLISVFNALHNYACNSVQMFNNPQIKALCRNNAAISNEDLLALKPKKITAGLRMPALFGDGDRVNILRSQARELEHRLGQGKPRIVECFIDVFGFSRGAAEARVFCSWLNELLTDGKLAGVPIRMRFLGLFDTVASAGFISGVTGVVLNTTNGHEGWADAKYLRIPNKVENCVHMVAMHELRKNFPLDSVSISGSLPAGCYEFAYPGSHSDVGGGYAPGELGIALGIGQQEDDALKLSQIPLNHMLECAAAAGAPIAVKNATNSKVQQTKNLFQVAPELQKAFADFLVTSGTNSRRPDQWLLPYLAWRWQVRHSYSRLHHVRHAAGSRQLLLDANASLIRDAEAIEGGGETGKGNRLFAAAYWMQRLRPWQMLDLKKHVIAGQLDGNAPVVLRAAQAAPQTPDALVQLFDKFVHDSYAGFCASITEPTGYWRYRENFTGKNSALPFVTTEKKAVNS